MEPRGGDIRSFPRDSRESVNFFSDAMAWALNYDSKPEVWGFKKKLTEFYKKLQTRGLDDENPIISEYNDLRVEFKSLKDKYSNQDAGQALGALSAEDEGIEVGSTLIKDGLFMESKISPDGKYRRGLDIAKEDLKQVDIPLIVDKLFSLDDIKRHLEKVGDGTPQGEVQIYLDYGHKLPYDYHSDGVFFNIRFGLSIIKGKKDGLYFYFDMNDEFNRHEYDGQSIVEFFKIRPNVLRKFFTKDIEKFGIDNIEDMLSFYDDEHDDLAFKRELFGFLLPLDETRVKEFVKFVLEKIITEKSLRKYKGNN